MVDSLRAVSSASLTIYRWQNAAKSVPQRVTALRPRPIRDRKSKKREGCPTLDFQGFTRRAGWVLKFPGIICAAPFTEINSESCQFLSATTATQRFFLVVQTLAVVLRDNSGIGIPPFLQLLGPASARAAIPRTSNPLQDYNSWAHRNERIAFPLHDSLLSHRLYPSMRPYKVSAHFAPRLTRLPICGKLIVYAAWFLRGCSVTGESLPATPPARSDRTLLPL
jgi:hypothetical protein